MHNSRNSFPAKYKYPYALVLLLLVFMGCMAFRMDGGDDFDTARKEVLLRKIGHELLLQSGDSTSRILPVKKRAGHEYQLSFEREFTFQPSALINITKHLLSKDPATADYVVKVLNCSDASVAYAFAVSGNVKEDILPCTGRMQPMACYKISITFKPAGLETGGQYYLLGSLPLLAFVGFVVLKSVKPRKTPPAGKPANTFTLGPVVFKVKEQQLIINGETLDLTGTETRLLLIFAMSPNETIQRSRLQKEIWEDEGVVVGRSLDVFISRLRKKLESVSNVNITVVRNKGYKLEITN